MSIRQCIHFSLPLPPITPATAVSPEADDSISATPLSRTSILVSWIASVFSRDPLLLRYSIFYTSGVSLDPTDYSTAQSVSDILPTLRNGSVSPQGIVEYVLSGLSVGTEYSISVRASFRDLNAPNSNYVALSSTYGQGWCMLTCICMTYEFMCMMMTLRNCMCNYAYCIIGTAFGMLRVHVHICILQLHVLCACVWLYMYNAVTRSCMVEFNYS